MAPSAEAFAYGTLGQTPTPGRQRRTARQGLASTPRRPTHEEADAFQEALDQVLLPVPTAFGWQRTTWTGELLGHELMRRGLPKFAVCTMGRALVALGARLGMPKPRVSCPWDPARRERVLRARRRLARTATIDGPVFFEDEMGVHLNPKIGRDWMPKGIRRSVRTPGQNRKRFIAGAINAATGKSTWVEPTSKASHLFCALAWTEAGEYRQAELSAPPSSAEVRPGVDQAATAAARLALRGLGCATRQAEARRRALGRWQHLPPASACSRRSS